MFRLAVLISVIFSTYYTVISNIIFLRSLSVDSMQGYHGTWTWLGCAVVDVIFLFVDLSMFLSKEYF